MNVSTMTSGVLSIIVGIIVIFYILGGTAPTLTTAATQISGNSALFGGVASLFAAGGPIWIVFIIAVFVAILYACMKLFGGHK
jgi:hypothetical protein